jgi:hypothetical protein
MSRSFARLARATEARYRDPVSRCVLVLLLPCILACADAVVRVELPETTAPLRVLIVGDGEAAPRDVWVLDDAALPTNLPAVALRGTVALLVLDYDVRPPGLDAGEYTLATAGEPAERLTGAVRVQRSVVTSDGEVTWSILPSPPAAVAVLDLRVRCPSDDLTDPTAPVRLPRHCPLSTAARGAVCYGAPIFEPSLAGAATASAAAELIDEALETVIEADGTRWIYGMSSRLDGPGSRRTLPARLRLASPLGAVPGSYERLPLVDEPLDALRGAIQGLRPRSDGLELYFATTFPDAGPQRVAQAWRPSLADPWSAARVRVLPPPDAVPPSVIQTSPVLLPDHQTLVFRSGSAAGATVVASRRTSTRAGDGGFASTVESLVVDGGQGSIGVIGLGLSCDRRHLLYTRLYADPAEPTRRWGEARIVALRSLEPLVLGQPQVVPVAGGPLDPSTTLGEAPDCSALYVSGTLLRVAPRVPCP